MMPATILHSTLKVNQIKEFLFSQIRVYLHFVGINFLHYAMKQFHLSNIINSKKYMAKLLIFCFYGFPIAYFELLLLIKTREN